MSQDNYSNKSQRGGIVSIPDFQILCYIFEQLKLCHFIIKLADTLGVAWDTITCPQEEVWPSVTQSMCEGLAKLPFFFCIFKPKTSRERGVARWELLPESCVCIPSVMYLGTMLGPKILLHL